MAFAREQTLQKSSAGLVVVGDKDRSTANHQEGIVQQNRRRTSAITDVVQLH
jgi:hypothetical protein